MKIPANPVLTQGAPYPFAALDAKKDAVRARGVRLFDFTIGDPLEPTPPFVREAMIGGIPEVSQYPTTVGARSLRESISRYFQRRFGVSLDPETEILPCSGAKEAIFHLPFALIDRASSRRGVVYGEPAYPVYERGAAYAGGDPIAVPLTHERGFLLEPDLVAPEVLDRTALYWLNYPHNPTGAQCDGGLYARVAEASARHGFVVASDETYADLWGDQPMPSMLNFAREGVVVIHSLSKRSGMTGYRSGFLAGDSRIIALLKKMRPSIGVASQVFVQAAAEAAWSDDAHVTERREIFEAKKRRIAAFCAGAGLEIVSSEAGLYVWIRVPAGHTSASYCERLLEQGVVLTPGESFGPSGAGYVRAALVPKLADLDAACEAWGRAHGSAGKEA